MNEVYLEKSYADTEKILVKLVEIAERAINIIAPFSNSQERLYFTVASLFELLSKDFIRENSNVKGIMERTYRTALDFFVTSTPTSEPTKYAVVIKNIAEKAKKQLDLTFGYIYTIDNLEKIIEELDYVEEEKKYDKYEHAHFGMWVDWDEYAKREKAVDEEMKKILEDMKKRK